MEQTYEAAPAVEFEAETCRVMGDGLGDLVVATFLHPSPIQ